MRLAVGCCLLVLFGSPQFSARGAEPQATAAKNLKLLPGFHAELLYSVPGAEQGSWVSLAVDPKGRLITSDQYGKLYRITVPAAGSSAGDAAAQVKVEEIPVELGMAHGLLYAFDSLYVVVNGPGSGLYRVKDTNNDDQFDSVQKLQSFEGAGEHGPHAVVLAPDGKSLYVAAGNHTKPPKFTSHRLPPTWQEDQLLPRMWDAGGHAVGVMAPGGWILRTDPDGKTLELISAGYRNEYDIAFNGAGELFTFDADMEWDIGSPWYRPTRVNHAVSGSEFGWRSGTGKWPAFYPDSLGAVVDIGPGSPTGIAFGTGARFPAKYQQALFMCDWSYGIIYAVHMTPDGASYSGTAEHFVSAAPLPATDIVVNPLDGALYFTVGGRKTQSGLYRVTYRGEEPTAPLSPSPDGGEKARAERRRLEAFHGKADPSAIAAAWPYLKHGDRFLRYAARIAIEHQPAAQWRDEALAERDPTASIQAIIALARCGEPADGAGAIEALNRIDAGSLPLSSQLDLLRAYGLVFMRLGADADLKRTVSERLSPLYPSDNVTLNQELCRILVYLETPGVIDRTLKLLASASTQEEQVHYVYCLRPLKSGWTPQQRKAYFQWFTTAGDLRGGHSFLGFVRNIRTEAIATLSNEEKASLGKLLEAPIQPTAPAAVASAARAPVRKWQTEELVSLLDAGLKGRNFEQGRKMFAVSECFKCHRFAGIGGSTGPDLTGVGRRFNTRDLATSIIEPSKVISDQYQSTAFVLSDGRTIVGRVANLNGDNIMVMTNMLEPGNLTSIQAGEIEETVPSPVSLMPTGALDTLNQEEVLDLVAYLLSGGDPNHEVFK